MICLVCFDGGFGVAAHANQQNSRSVRAQQEGGRGGEGLKRKRERERETYEASFSFHPGAESL